jgi:hypothetical protein
VQKEIEALSIFPELSTIEWGHHIGQFPSWKEPVSKAEKIRVATTVLRKSKFRGDKRIVIHHPYKAALPNLPYGRSPVVPEAATVPPKEEDGYEEVFKLPREAK